MQSLDHKGHHTVVSLGSSEQRPDHGPMFLIRYIGMSTQYRDIPKVHCRRSGAYRSRQLVYPLPWYCNNVPVESLIRLQWPTFGTF